jgi:hypothetical protein
VFDRPWRANREPRRRRILAPGQDGAPHWTNGLDLGPGFAWACPGRWWAGPGPRPLLREVWGSRSRKDPRRRPKTVPGDGVGGAREHTCDEHEGRASMRL